MGDKQVRFGKVLYRELNLFKKNLPFNIKLCFTHIIIECSKNNCEKNQVHCFHGWF